jgi:murein DD-endopeptidase MepM/ murein hydrolase activator NlpD
LIVPHKQEEIMSIRLSPALIFFVLFMVAILLFFSSMTLIQAEDIYSKKEVLKEEHAQDLRLTQKYRAHFNQIQQLLQRIRPKLEQAHAIIGKDQRTFRHIATRELAYVQYPVAPIGDEAKGQKRMPLHSILHHMEFVLRNYASIHSFIKTKEQVLHQIPSSWPVTGGFISSLYGVRFNPFNQERSMHNGIDIAHAVGTPIRSVAPGEVISSGSQGKMGQMVIIKHRYGFVSLYGHNSKNLVQKGDRVHQGQVIAEVGQTGYATGPHVHYGLRIGSEYTDPYPYLLLR